MYFHDCRMYIGHRSISDLCISFRKRNSRLQFICNLLFDPLNRKNKKIPFSFENINIFFFKRLEKSDETRYNIIKDN